MTESADTKQKIIDAYIELLKKLNRLPQVPDFLDHDITRSHIRTHFGNLTRLHEAVRSSHFDLMSEHIGHEDYIFNIKRLDKLAEEFQGVKTFIITTAVSGKDVDLNLLASIENYLGRANGKLILIATEDIASRSHDNWSFVIDRNLKDQFFVRDEFRLNDNLFISNIKVSAKQILPTTGLSRIGQTNGSYIFASPKQMLEFVATSPAEKHAKAITTTGAITVPNYSTDKWMSQRTSYIATHDHVMGGLIVEIVDNRVFHFRHFQANHQGEFIDLGVCYKPDGSTEKVRTHMYAGDLHSGHVDDEAFDATMALCKELEVEDFMVGDFFDGYSISHHHMNQPSKRAAKSLHGTDDLIEELEICGTYINIIHKHIAGHLVMIRGNHDEVLERYLQAGNYTKDFKNQYVALEMARWQIEGFDVLPKAFETHAGYFDTGRVTWLGRDDPHKIGGIECGQHGDLGPNGSSASMLGMEKAYGNCIVGHTHSAAIMRGVYRVGTLSKLSLEYNRGPSSWTHTNCLVYEDGSRQLINVIYGQTHLKR